MQGVIVPCPHADDLPGRRVVCDDCQRGRKNAASRAWYLEHREQALERAAARYQEHRERRLAQISAYYYEHREELLQAGRERYYRDHQATLERKRRDREAIKADPERAAYYREYRRMWQRMKAERDGNPLPPVPEHRYPAPSTKWTVDGEPIRALVRRWEAMGGSRRELAAVADVSERLLYRLMHGDGEVTVAAADRIAVACGLHIDLIVEGAGL